MFKIGESYSKKDIYKLLNVPKLKQEGAWDTGMHFFDGVWYIFSNLGVPGTTGHDYSNYWDGNELIWSGRTKSNLKQPSIISLISPEITKHIFYRTSNKENWTYAGCGIPKKVYDSTPVKIIWEFKPQKSDINPANNIENTWLEDIVQAFDALGGVATLQEINNYIENHSKKEFTKTWKNTVRAVIYAHSSDSKYFLSSSTNEDLFTTPEGVGSGVWALRSKIEETPIAVDYLIDEENNDNAAKRSDITISRIIRDSKNSRILKIIYANKCQICGKSIKLKDGKYYSEGHHLKPLGKSHNGPDKPSNIIVLCPNHHTEFDYGIIAINPETLHIIHKDPNNKHIGQKLYVDERHNLNIEYLQYHFATIYS